MLLVLRVLGHEEREAVVDTTLLEELLELLLKSKVECLELARKSYSDATSARDKKQANTHLRSNVESAALPVGLGGEFRRELGVFVERHVLDDERTLLTHRVDAHRARHRRLWYTKKKTCFKPCYGVKSTEISVPW